MTPTARKVSPVNPANAVTAARFLFLPPFAWAVVHGYHQWATFAMLGCGLFDKLDGLVARVFDCRTAFGELFDAITDALCYGFGLVFVAIHGWAPVVPVALIIVMGVANTGMRVAYGIRAGRATNYKSYAMERLVAYTGYLIGLSTSGYEVRFFFWVFPFVMIAILAYDAKRMLIDPIAPAAPAAAPAETAA